MDSGVNEDKVLGKAKGKKLFYCLWIEGKGEIEGIEEIEGVYFRVEDVLTGFMKEVVDEFEWNFKGFRVVQGVLEEVEGKLVRIGGDCDRWLEDWRGIIVEEVGSVLVRVLNRRLDDEDERFELISDFCLQFCLNVGLDSSASLYLAIRAMTVLLRICSKDKKVIELYEKIREKIRNFRKNLEKIKENEDILNSKRLESKNKRFVNRLKLFKSNENSLDLDCAEIYERYSDMLEADFKFRESLELLTECLIIYKKVFDESNLKIYNCHQNIGICFMQLGEFDMAQKHFDECYKWLNTNWDKSIDQFICFNLNQAVRVLGC